MAGNAVSSSFYAYVTYNLLRMSPLWLRCSSRTCRNPWGSLLLPQPFNWGRGIDEWDKKISVELKSSSVDSVVSPLARDQNSVERLINKLIELSLYISIIKDYFFNLS